VSVRAEMSRTMPQDPVDALIRRLAASEPRGRPEGGTSDEHMRLATYVDGGMPDQEKAAFEQELAGSADRREELVGSVAWFDELDAKRQPAPDHLVRQVLALDRRAPVEIAQPWWRGWLPVSGRQWAFAAASVAASVVAALIAVQAMRDVATPEFKLPQIAGRDRPAEVVATGLRRPAATAVGKQGSE